MKIGLRHALSFGGLVFFAAMGVATSKPSGSTSSSGDPTPTVATTTTPPVVTAPPATDLPSVWDQDIVQRLTKKLTVAAGCPSATAPHRIWCAVDGFAGGTRAPLGQGAMIGLTIGLSEDFPAEQSLLKNVELSALGVDVRAGGTWAWISSIKPTQPSENKGIAEAVFNAAGFFKKTNSEVKLDAGLFGYVEGLPKSAKYPLKQATNAWRIAGPASTDLRKVGDTWIAIEVPPARPLRGIYVTLLTSKYGK